MGGHNKDYCRTQPTPTQCNPCAGSKPPAHLLTKLAAPSLRPAMERASPAAKLPCPVPLAASLPAMWFIARTKWRRQDASSPSLTATLASFISWNQQQWNTGRPSAELKSDSCKGITPAPAVQPEFKGHMLLWPPGLSCSYLAMMIAGRNSFRGSWRGTCCQGSVLFDTAGTT